MAECVALTSEGFVQAIQQDPCEAFLLVTSDEWGETLAQHELWAPNYEVAQWAAGSVIFMFTAGIGIGLLIQIARKARK